MKVFEIRPLCLKGSPNCLAVSTVISLVKIIATQLAVFYQILGVNFQGFCWNKMRVWLGRICHCLASHIIASYILDTSTNGI